MKKRVFLLLLCLTLVICMLASCDKGNETPAGSDATNPPSGEKGHVHTYSDTLSKDAEGHWYEATCECEDVETKKADHVDANNDGACDICTFTDHEHVYDTENWTVDCTNHWHAALCGHVVAGTDVAAHADANEDGKCDVCAYVIKDIHVHVFDDEWTTDASNHWHAALCEHKAEIADKAAHNVDGTGKCTVCGVKVKDIDETKIEDVLAAAAANRNNIKRGNVEFKYVMDGQVWMNDKILYVLGQTSTFRQVTNQVGTAYEDYQMQWLEYLGTNEAGEDDIFGVASKDGVNIEPIAGAPELLNGYYYAGSSIVDGKSLEEFIANIYAFTKNNDVNAVIIDPTNPTAGNHAYASNVVITNDAKENTYAISFDYLTVAVNKLLDDSYTIVPFLYKFNVEFRYSDSLVIIESYITVDCYQDGQAVASDVDFSYNMADGSFTMLGSATADSYNFYTVQVEGERNYNTIYPKDSFVPTDFDIFTDAGCTDEVEEVETVYYLSYTKFYLGNLFPVTSSLDYIDADDMSVVITDAEGNDAGWYVTTPTAIVPYFSFTPKVTEGTYTVTLTYKKVVKSFTIEVEVPDATDVKAYGFTTVTGFDGPVLTVDETTFMDVVRVDAGESFNFVVKVDPRGAAQGYTYESSNATTITEIDVTDCVIFGDSYGEDFETGEISYGKALQFISYVEGTYEVVFTSEDGKATGKLTVVVGNGGGNAPTGQSFNVVIPSSELSSGDHVTFTANVAGNYEITCDEVPANVWLYACVGNGSWTRIDKQLPYSVTLAANGTVDVRAYAAMGCSELGEIVSVSIALKEDEGGEEPEQPTPDQPGTEGGNLNDTITEGDGSYDAPFVLPTVGTYSAAYDGGYDLVQYTFTATADGFLSLESPIDQPWLNLGSKGNEGVGGLTIFVTEGQVVEIGVGDWTETAGDVEFTLSFEAVISQPIAAVIGDWEASSMWGTSYGLSILPNGTGTFTEDRGWGEPDEYAISQVIRTGNTVIVVYTNAGGLTTTLELVLGDSALTCEELGVTFAPATGDSGDDGQTADGSFANPYALEESNSCDFPGGYNYVFYSYTAESAGTLTVTVISSDFDWGYGSGEWALNNVGNAVNTADIALAAGETIYIGMSTNSTDSGVIEFTSSFVASGSTGGDEGDEPEQPASNTALNIGPNSIDAANVNFEYTATEAGTLNLSAGNAIKGMVSMSYTVNGGDSTVLELGTAVDLVLEAGDVVVITVEAEGYSSIQATWTADAAGGDEEEGGSGLVVGANTLYFSADEVAANEATRTFVATEAGEYKFASGSLFIASLTDADGNTITMNDNYRFDLVAGTYTVNFKSLSMFGVKADVAQTLNITIS